MNLTGHLSQLKNGQSLSSDQMQEAMNIIMSGGAGTADIEEFLLSLRKKGESVDEITSAVRVMRQHAVKLSKAYPNLLDTCGTGGDAKNTLNISTLSALVACAAGARVAKHGNRSVSSVCGSADLLEMLGVKISLDSAGVERCIETVGFGFFFAPNFHPATKAAMPARKNIQGKTLFNLLGPLTNPAGADFQLIGVYSKPLVRVFAEVLSRLGSKRALVVHGLDGLDEISLSGPSCVAELYEGSIREYQIEPRDFGLLPVVPEAFVCQHKEENRQKALKVLEGVPGPGTDVVCMNAAAALYVCGNAPSLKEGFLMAQKTVHSHQAMDKLDHLIECSNDEEAE